MRRPIRMAVVGMLACTLTAGCGLLPGTTTETCVDWVRFETAQDQFRDAALVLIGRPVGTDGETSIYGYTARVYRVEVESVLKGEPGPAPLRIASTPTTCSRGVSYPDGDPLSRDQRMLIFASKEDGGWFTQTPAQGAVPFPERTPLPFRTG
ncbi:hypothetical protein [Pseudarthrobacter sp. S9]|uniref:hypothetical protein n=1 Tax=Pseudarthrobacter sp. S9 TaxID=3418421 RepID=UPI003D016BBB